MKISQEDQFEKLKAFTLTMKNKFKIGGLSRQCDSYANIVDKLSVS